MSAGSEDAVVAMLVRRVVLAAVSQAVRLALFLPNGTLAGVYLGWLNEVRPYLEADLQRKSLERYVRHWGSHP